MKRLRLLLSAYACEPGRGSEPGVGWNLACGLAARHDVWVVTRANNREAIEQALARRPVPGLTVVYHDLPAWARWWKRGQRGVQLYYYLWQLTLAPLARRLHTRIGFDVVQHATLGKYWAPSGLAGLAVPFVWGPVGGGESAPASFLKSYGLRGHLYERLRDAARWLGERDPLVRRTARRCHTALVATPETAARVRALGARAVVFLWGQTGLTDAEIAPPQATAAAPAEAPLRLISIGRLLHWKGYHLSLEAFARAALPGATYALLGEGPEQARLETLARRLGLAGRVHFLGSRPRAEVLERLARADVFVHPSLHDFSPTVVLEAMGQGKPVVALDLGGPGVQLTPETGIKVAAPEPAAAVAALAEALRRYAADPALRHRHGQAGRQRAATLFSWPAKIDQVDAVLRAAAGLAPGPAAAPAEATAPPAEVSTASPPA